MSLPTQTVVLPGPHGSPPGLASSVGAVRTTILLTHKIALDPNKKQLEYFAQAAGTARFAWNWALNEWQRHYEAGGKPNEGALRRQLNAVKHQEFPWMAEVSKAAPQQAIKNLGKAFQRFFQGKSKYPRFKRKGVHDSFRADNGPETFTCDRKRIKLPIIGWVKMFEALRFAGKPMSVVVSRVAGRWFAAVTVEVEHVVPVRENQAAVGVDLGVKSLATLSTGEVVAGPKALKMNLRKLRRLSRAVSRKVKGSANRRKAVRKLGRLHARINNIRQDALHKLTTSVVQRFTVIGIEDLHVKGMVRNHCLARAVSDVGMGEFRRQIEYKAAMYGSRIVLADRWFPSSKTCSVCGVIQDELPLSVRAWTCPDCGTRHDRDVNAAINLKNLAVSSTESQNACGEKSSGWSRKAPVKLVSKKQELGCVS